MHLLPVQEKISCMDKCVLEINNLSSFKLWRSTDGKKHIHAVGKKMIKQGIYYLRIKQSIQNCLVACKSSFVLSDQLCLI